MRLHKHPTGEQDASHEEQLERIAHALLRTADKALAAEVRCNVRLEVSNSFLGDASANGFATVACKDFVLVEGSNRFSAAFET